MMIPMRGFSTSPASILTPGRQHPTTLPSALPNPLASGSPSTPHEPRDLPHLGTTFRPLHPAECGTRTVHTIKFQRVEHGSYETELKIEETDSLGYSKVRSLERYFYGIVGHLINGSQATQHLQIIGVTILVSVDRVKHSQAMRTRKDPHLQRPGMQCTSLMMFSRMTRSSSFPY